LLKREGIHVNKKRVYRLYSEDGLQLRSKRPRRHVTAATRQPPRAKPQAPNVAWSMDFVSDQTVSGQRFRALTVVDVFSRECLAIEPGQKPGGADVVNVLSRIAAERSSPRRLYCDNGSGFSSRLVDLGAYANQGCHGVLPTRKAHRQRIHRVIQRYAPGRMPERPLVRRFDGRKD
jgi:putative transposase